MEHISRVFDPKKMAELDLARQQAAYREDMDAFATLHVQILQEQFGMKPDDAYRARIAYAAFIESIELLNTAEGAESEALFAQAKRSLTQYFEVIRAATERQFDPSLTALTNLNSIAYMEQNKISLSLLSMSYTFAIIYNLPAEDLVGVMQLREPATTIFRGSDESMPLTQHSWQAVYTSFLAYYVALEDLLRSKSA